MNYSVTRKKLETDKNTEIIPTNYVEKCTHIENVPKIKFRDHSKNFERPDYTYEETPDRAAELAKIEKLEFEKIKLTDSYL